jgi:glutathione synthase/RimK-type ligase-like ATP-grasp enzyme
MNVLVTSSRFPHAVGVIRRLGEEGHAVFASDTFRAAPGSHSRYVARAFITASPTFDTERWIQQLEEIVDSHRIDLVVPSFEEVLYLAEHLERLERRTSIFCSPLATLARLHDKSTFVELARELGLRVPETRVVRSAAELRRALAEIPEHIARPIFSRGGVTLLTNTGPLAGRMPVEACRPTALQPWIVQEFVHGTEVCSFSVAHHGRLVAHCTYEHPKTIEHAGGILFESVDEPRSIDLARTIVEALGYHGHISLDYVRTTEGLVLLECNPRPTAGIFMTTARDYCRATFESPRDPIVVPPGIKKQIAVAIVRDMFRNWREIPNDLDVLLSGIEDVYSERGDPLPALYCFLTYPRILAFRRKQRLGRRSPTDLVASQFFDVLWDGSRLASERERQREAGALLHHEGRDRREVDTAVAVAGIRRLLRAG